MPTTYPATYNTSSTTLTDLDGTMIMSDADTVSSYTSTAQNATVTPQNEGGTGLHFSVKFPNVAKPYQINATANGTGFKGDATEEDDPEGGLDNWDATAV